MTCSSELFAKQRDDLGLAVEQRLDDGVVLDGDAGLSSAGESGDAGVVELESACALEELGVLGIGAGPAAFDEVHAQRVEIACDLQFVFDGENAIRLRPVAKRGVVDFDVCRHTPILPLLRFPARSRRLLNPSRFQEC